MKDQLNESNEISKLKWVTRTFALIGVLVTVVAGLTTTYWTLTQMYDRNIDYSVKAKGDIKTFPVPPSQRSSLPKEMQDVKSVWEYFIKNLGRETLEDLKLDKLPKGSYQLTLNGNERPTEQCNGTIALPRLAQSDNLKITIWSLSEAVIPIFDQAPILNHRRGSVDIEYARIYSSWDESSRFVLICSSLTLFFLCLGACIYIVILRDKLNRSKRNIIARAT